MDQFLQPKEFMKERCRNPWPEHDHHHHSIDQILDLCHAPFSAFQRLLNVAVALITDCNVDGQVFLSVTHFLKPLSVSAKRARCPSFPGFFAAAASFFAGIVLPSLMPNSLRRAPGCLIAFWMNLVAICRLLLLSFFLHFLNQLEHFLERSSSQVRHDVIHECG